MPFLQRGNIIYESVCRGDFRYVGSTSQRLQDGIIQHVFKSITLSTKKQRQVAIRKQTQGYSFVAVSRQLDSFEAIGEPQL